MKVQISSILLLLIGVTVAFPTKDREIDELIYRLQELKHQNGASNMIRSLDSLGGGNIIRSLDSLGGGNIVRSLDSLGGGNIVRSLDSLGGGNIVRSLDSLGGGNIVRNLDALGGGNIVRNLDSLGGGNIVRNLDSLGGGNIVRSTRPFEDAPQFFIRSLDSIGGELTPGSVGPHTRTDVATQSYQKNKKPVDLDIAPLLYNYYTTGVAPSPDEYINHKRFDEIDRFGFGTFKRQVDNMRPTQYIDNSAGNSEQPSEKRAQSAMSRGMKRFDEIDRINFGDFS